MKGGFIYIVTNISHAVLYTGVTSNLPGRIRDHKEKRYPKSFSAKYDCHILVYYEYFTTIVAAIAREKQIKGGSRKKKLGMINKLNPEWKDLFEEASRVANEAWELESIRP